MKASVEKSGCIPKPCGEWDGYAHKDDIVDTLGRKFVLLNLQDKYGITFERYIDMIQSGSWEEVKNDYIGGIA